MGYEKRVPGCLQRKLEQKDGASMRTINRSNFLSWVTFRRCSKKYAKHMLLGTSVLAALLSFGCPQNDPLQVFNDPAAAKKPTDPNQAPAPAPEPASALLFGVALLVGGGILRRRKTGAPR